MTRLTVIGARGRMGSCICRLAQAGSRFEIVAEIDRAETRSETVATDVVIDFSSPEGAERSVALALAHGAALLVGTTGLRPRIVRILDDAADRVPVMIAPNTSRGVAVLNHLALEGARLLGRGFEVSIVETHHVGKRDAPSGTALRIAAALAEGAGVEVPRERIKSIREGAVVGEHKIRFEGPEERLRLVHAVRSRDVFARGALEAAAWLEGKSPGRYVIEDALGLPRRAMP